MVSVVQYLRSKIRRFDFRQVMCSFSYVYSLRKQPSFFANATRVGSKEGRLFSQATTYMIAGNRLQVYDT